MIFFFHTISEHITKYVVSLVLQNSIFFNLIVIFFSAHNDEKFKFSSLICGRENDKFTFFKIYNKNLYVHEYI